PSARPSLIRLLDAVPPAVGCAPAGPSARGHSPYFVFTKRSYKANFQSRMAHGRLQGNTMRTGKSYLEALANRGGEVYVGSERIDNVATHPAFRNAARAVAALYDITSDPKNRDQLTFVDPEDGRRYSNIFLKPKSRADLEARNRAHDAWARSTWGLFGRSPDHVAGWITGMACCP